jgi:hypothetical protein
MKNILEAKWSDNIPTEVFIMQCGEKSWKAEQRTLFCKTIVLNWGGFSPSPGGGGSWQCLDILKQYVYYKMYNLVAFNIFTNLCTSHHDLTVTTFCVVTAGGMYN